MTDHLKVSQLIKIPISQLTEYSSAIQLWQAKAN